MKYQRLTTGQKYAISAYLSHPKGMTLTEIAQNIGVDKSTVSREIRRNCDLRNKHYMAALAIRKAQKRIREKRHFVRMTSDMKNTVDEYIKKDYSPEQIHGEFKRNGKDMVSPETIYKYIWKDKLHGSKELYKHLRRRGRHNHKRGNSYNRHCMVDRVDIEERPAVVDDRARFGDLEIDTVIGANHKGAIMTINDWATGILFMRLLSGKEAKPLADMAIDTLSPIKHLLHTMTADNGKEFAEHKRIAENLGISVYFAHPYHFWERGANENLNGLVRQYIPKGD